MSENTLKARLVHPCKTDAEWASSNPVAKKGEIMISSDKSGMFKVGDGTNKWSDLQYNHVTWENVEGKPSTFSPSAHKHTKSDITDFPSSMVNPHSIIIKLNDGTTEGTNLFTYNGGSSKTINITAGSIGAAYSSHVHNYAGSTSPGGTANSAAKLYAPVNIGEASFDGSKSITLKEMGINNPIEITLDEYNQLKQSGKLDMEAYYNIIDDYDAIGLIDDNSAASNQVFSSLKTEAIYSKKSKIYDVTLLSSKWENRTTYYEYNISLTTVSETNTIEVNISSLATSSMITAYQSACLKPGVQSSGNFSILASVKPSIDIDIVVIVHNDI